MLTAQRGTYVVVFACTKPGRKQIGKWGILTLKHGYYSYIGSAFGGGGVRARVSRHFRRHKVMRWHVDYLSTRCTPALAWCSYSAERLEHHWATSFMSVTGAFPVVGFGCSDCACESHLFHTPNEPFADEFQALCGTNVLVHRPD